MLNDRAACIGRVCSSLRGRTTVSKLVRCQGLDLELRKTVARWSPPRITAETTVIQIDPILILSFDKALARLPRLGRLPLSQLHERRFHVHGFWLIHANSNAQLIDRFV